MTALVAARSISQYDGPDWFIKVPIKDGVKVYHGAMVGKAGDNYWAPATTAIAPLGVADLQSWDDQTRTGQASVFASTSGQYIDNTSGADGDRHFNVRRGVFKMKNKGGDLVTEVHIGGLVYVEDDQTVRATAAGTVAAGVLIGFDDRDSLPLVAIGQTITAYGAA